jgi:hypothetical protein
MDGFEKQPDSHHTIFYGIGRISWGNTSPNRKRMKREPLLIIAS